MEQLSQALQEVAHFLREMYGDSEIAVLAEDDRRIPFYMNQTLGRWIDLGQAPRVRSESPLLRKMGGFVSLVEAPDSWWAQTEALVVKGKESLSQPLQLIDGRLLQFDYQPVDATSRPPYHIWLFRELEPQVDATPSHQRLSLLHAKDRAEAASEAKSRFLATVSHEIRTPLHVILGMSELFQDTPLNSTQRNLLKTLQVSSESLLQLINDFLDVSKIEAGQVEISSFVFDLNELLTGTAELMRVRAQLKGLTVNLQVQDDVPLSILGDANRLRQILINLMNNAVKFTPKGHVSLEVEVARSEPEAQQIELMFRVSDTGVGIPVPLQSRVFERFVQVDDQSRKSFFGTGLGLSICRSLSQLMGGRLWLEWSEPQKGSSFVVRLPFQTASIEQLPNRSTKGETSSVQQLAACAKSRHLRILVAEDSDDNQLILQRMLGAFGLRVTLVEHGGLALMNYKERGFDLILMDVEMPVCDGLEASRLIRQWEEDEQLPRTPIIALTAHALEGVQQDCMRAGMDDYLTKPTRRNDLMSMLGRWIDLRHPVVLIPGQPALAGRLQTLFESQDDYRLVAPSSLKEALKMARRTEFVLFVIDLDQGQPQHILTMFRAIAGENAPILGISKDDSGERLRQSLEMGCHAFLPVGRLEAEFLRMARHLSETPFGTRVSAVFESFASGGAWDAGTIHSNESEHALAPEENGTIHVKVDPDLVDLIPDFLVKREREVEEFEKLIQQRDAETVRSLAHRLKGSGGAYGFDRLTEIAAALEVAAKASDYNAMEQERLALAAYLSRLEWSV